MTCYFCNLQIRQCCPFIKLTYGVLTVRFMIEGGNGITYDLLNARGDKKCFKTLPTMLADLKNIDPGLNQDSKISFYFVE